MMQVPAEVTTNRKNKIHKTWGRQFSRALPSHSEYDPLQARYVLRHGLGRWGRSLERASLFSSVDRNGILMWVRKTEEMATQNPRGRRSAAEASGLRWQPFQTTNSCRRVLCSPCPRQDVTAMTSVRAADIRLTLHVCGRGKAGKDPSYR